MLADSVLGAKGVNQHCSNAFGNGLRMVKYVELTLHGTSAP